ncbi:hypothetical protein PTSG_03378 [Salpingoeca rosetta]|uniref:Aspartyl/asparaginy/proline hydroxylase domain-containing protein n=1 Tax=Salpingoeca rosetta (strain ATCC 50818 / BSB-021) TaxID=946362 RepID=F2U512_SALR5|nr:uncharacterized protein PTSG_03378 [Salpingoeca rosetta]EGD82728.1 hypothetical protein PTSG_03378 [Salpingoeca rosetta]|eukprot:XP_004995964.1 hypothetical protein PTSG_03378 [Salpingoeca rosetta]
MIASLDQFVDEKQWQEVVEEIQRVGVETLNRSVDEADPGRVVYPHGVVTESKDPETHVDGAAVKRFETSGNVSDSTFGLYLRMPTAKGAMEHQNRSRSDMWEDAPLFNKFPKFKAFIEEQVIGKVLKEMGRIWVIIDRSGKDGIRHRDHTIPDVLNEFLWLRAGTAKTIQVFSEDSSAQPQRCTGHAGWFDPRYEHQAVCLDPDTPAISIRIDGPFTDEARKAVSDYQPWAPAASVGN